jgi:hypothetical protein
MEVRFGMTAGRGVIAATVLGSGIAFLDSRVVDVATLAPLTSTVLAAA